MSHHFQQYHSNITEHGDIGMGFGSKSNQHIVIRLVNSLSRRIGQKPCACIDAGHQCRPSRGHPTEGKNPDGLLININHRKPL
jgi:hypothetical protein